MVAHMVKIAGEAAKVVISHKRSCIQSVVEESPVDGRVKLNCECQQVMNTEARRLQRDFPCTKLLSGSLACWTLAAPLWDPS